MSSGKKDKDESFKFKKLKNLMFFTARHFVDDDEYSQDALSQTLGKSWTANISQEATDQIIVGLARVYTLGPSMLYR